MDGVSRILVNGLQGTSDYPMYQKMKMVIGYSPRQVVFSSSYARKRWGVAVDIAWQQWSLYEDNEGFHAGFHDIVEPSVGGFIDVGRGFKIRSGLRYIPTPVPAQTGRTNYVDNNSIVWGIGMNKFFKLKKQNTGVYVGIYTQFQFFIPKSVQKDVPHPYKTCATGVKEICDEVPDTLKDPQTGKQLPQAKGLQTGNPGFPGFSSGGWYAVAGLDVTWRY